MNHNSYSTFTLLNSSFINNTAHMNVLASNNVSVHVRNTQFTANKVLPPKGEGGCIWCTHSCEVIVTLQETQQFMEEVSASLTIAP